MRRLAGSAWRPARLIDVGELPAYRFGRVIRLKGCDLDMFVERSRIEAGTLNHLHELESVDGT